GQVASFTDDFVQDPASAYSAVIDWGDGFTSTGTVSPDLLQSPGHFIVKGSHTYNLARNYNVAVLIQDPGGMAGVAQSTASVVFDPVTTTSYSSVVRGNDPQRGNLIPLGEALLDVNNGVVRLSQPLDFDKSPGTDIGGNPALYYNSGTVHVRPIIE